MSLRFTYEQPPRIRLIRHQTINFFVGEPHIHFYKKKRSSMVKSESNNFLREAEREKERDRDRDKDKVKERSKERERDRKREKERDRESERDFNIERESRSESNFLEKKKSQKQKITSSVEKSFSGCNDLLQLIKSKKKLKVLFDLVGPEPNLAQIEVNLLNCSYKTIDEFFMDLLDFFDCACESFISDPEVEKSAQHFRQTIEQTQRKMVSRGPSVPFSYLNQQFQDFLNVKVSLPKQSNSSSTESSSSRNLEKIAQDLNKLSSKKKLRAEWIVRIQCPSLPYYSCGIDLCLLPDSAIKSLIELINSE